jgi:putative flippase GtrA
MVFIAGGLLCAIIDVGVMQMLLMATVPVMLATSAGFFAGLGINFIFHSKVTFKRASNASTVGRYLCVVLINYVITLAIVYAAVALGASAIAGKVFALPLIAVNGFLLSKFWIYR